GSGRIRQGGSHRHRVHAADEFRHVDLEDPLFVRLRGVEADVGAAGRVDADLRVGAGKGLAPGRDDPAEDLGHVAVLRTAALRARGNLDRAVHALGNLWLPAGVALVGRDGDLIPDVAFALRWHDAAGASGSARATVTAGASGSARATVTAGASGSARATVTSTATVGGGG